ncbi:hypothetical protein [Microbacterium azadirachtae]|uniref:Uncharacterized protein n=1 Tax=Microbacterium azadirachtae TaxID=582680 RepID=A0A0F0KUM2_9MICO|nr:hypothetical protein [Microbacterium azadirachtae]KJL24583.1 hypothetical protein RL72_01665 [Microbacterium azadirachtae]SDL70381.1 hypothetical protein SAMN04488593_1648 [Microbacterium azadirachtae]SEG00066.1 hypothetical protein SAMN04488594_1635 [Microbacterium azadirachtae]SEG02303.1 hypothetical protein SAMN04488592_1645 [Microbacterium azadirachtae]
MNTTLSPSPETVASSRRAAFRPVLLLSWAFVAVSAAMIAFLGVASATGIGFETAIWIRCSLVLASAVVVLAIAASAARGSRGAWVRLRIISPIIVAAVVVIVSIPGFLPDWVRLEQALCGLLLLPVAILVNLPRMRALFAPKA